MDEVERENQQQRVSVIFLHIPKTAGRTLQDVLDRKYKRSEAFSIDPNRVRESTEEFKGLPYDQRSKIRLLKGHMPFGLHEFLPNQSTYVTILRNPIDRIISHYYYVIRHPNHHLYNKVKYNKLSLKGYVASGISIELDNFQMRSLAGATDLGFGKCSSELLEQAKCHLQSHFTVVGLTERFDETLILMKRDLQWHTPPFYTELNVSRNRPLLEDIPRDTLDLIEKYNELDCELYEYTRKIFQQKIE